MTEATFRERATQKNREAYDRAVALIKGRSLDKAEELLQSIIDKEPGFAPAYNKLGVIRMRRGDRQRAYEWFESAVDVDPDYPPALTNVGNFLLERGNRTQAMAYYRRCLDVDGSYGPAHNGLGVALRQEGRLTESLKHLKIARRRRSYHVSEESWSTPAGKRGCLFLTVAVVIVIAFAVVLIIRG